MLPDVLTVAEAGIAAYNGTYQHAGPGDFYTLNGARVGVGPGLLASSDCVLCSAMNYATGEEGGSIDYETNQPNPIGIWTVVAGTAPAPVVNGYAEAIFYAPCVPPAAPTIGAVSVLQGNVPVIHLSGE